MFSLDRQTTDGQNQLLRAWASGVHFVNILIFGVESVHVY